MGKIEFRLEHAGNFLMPGVFFAVVAGHGKHPLYVRFKHFNQRCAYQSRLLTEYVPDAGELCFSFNGGDQSALMIFADDRIDFPVADPNFFIDDGRTLINADPVRYLSAAVFGFNAFAAFFPSKTKMRVKFSAALLFVNDEPVDGFITDGRLIVRLQPTADLFGTPILFQTRDDLSLDLVGKAGVFVSISSPLKSPFIRLFVTIAFESFVPFNFTAERRFTHLNQFGRFGLVEPGLE